MVDRVGKWWDEQIKDIKLTQDGKYIRRLLMVGKICGVSIVDYGKRLNN